MSTEDEDDDIFSDEEKSIKNKKQLEKYNDKEDTEDDDNEDDDEDDDSDDADEDIKLVDKSLQEKKTSESLSESQDLNESDVSNHSDEDLSDTESKICDDVEIPYIFSIDTMKNKSIDYSLPEVILKEAKRKANLYAKKKMVNKCIHEYIRCLALTRIVYGLEHWKIVESHVSLANAYFEMKGYTVQAFHHVELAKDILSTKIDLVEFVEDKPQIVNILLQMQYLLGRAYTANSKYSEAEGALKKAEIHYKEYVSIAVSVSSSIKLEWQLKLSLAFARLSFKQNRHAASATYFEKALQLVIKRYSKSSTLLISIYQSLGKVEQSKGKSSNESKTIEYFLQAHSISTLNYGSQSIEVFDSGYAVALAYANMSDADAELSAESYLKEAVEGYKQLLGPSHEKTLEAQDELARLMIRTDNIDAGIDILQSTISCKEKKYGWFSGEMAESYKLIGSSYLALENSTEAFKALEKCLQIEKLVYGHQSRRAKETEASLGLLTPSSQQRKSSSSRRNSTSLKTNIK